ncbi:MAG: hypothetical protein AABW79_01605 [Nanoarchaeota archaeon]
MTNITLSVPEELAIRMKKFTEIKWSEIARRAIEQRVNDLEILNEIASKSKLTNEDVEKISKSIKSSATKKLYASRGH